jgi:hypothetical protein
MDEKKPVRLDDLEEVCYDTTKVTECSTLYLCSLYTSSRAVCDPKTVCAPRAQMVSTQDTVRVAPMFEMRRFQTIQDIPSSCE